MDMEGNAISRLVESILFTGGPPTTLDDLLVVLPGTGQGNVVEAIAHLNQHYHRQGRPYEIRRSGAGYQMILRPSFASILRRVQSHHGVRFSVAAIEVLALVAYLQPVRRQTMDSIRGTDCGSILRQLRRRNLIEPTASSETAGEGPDYQTTQRFLDLFHLKSLTDLPRVQELERP